MGEATSLRQMQLKQLRARAEGPTSIPSAHLKLTTTRQLQSFEMLSALLASKDRLYHWMHMDKTYTEFKNRLGAG